MVHTPLLLSRLGISHLQLHLTFQKHKVGILHTVLLLQATISEVVKTQFLSNTLLLPTTVGEAVMMGWERPLMERHAAAICGQGGGHYLNVGFGLGIIDTEIQVRWG